MLEVAIPASDHRGEVGNDFAQAVASGATGLFAYLVLEPLQALFPHPALACLEPVAQKLKTLSRNPAVPDTGFIDYREKLKALGITVSMSRKGNCWDNAPMESANGTRPNRTRLQWNVHPAISLRDTSKETFNHASNNPSTFDPATGSRYRQAVG